LISFKIIIVLLLMSASVVCRVVYQLRVYWPSICRVASRAMHFLYVSFISS